MRQIYINQDFAKLWFHQAFKILNERFRELVIPLIVLGLTGSPLVTALVLLSQQLGTLLFSIPVGTLVEKGNPVSISFYCSFIQVGFIFSLAYAVSIDRLHPIAIACLLVLIGMVALVQQTAFHLLIPKIAGREKLLTAHNLLEGADACVTLVGPAIGGYILAKYGGGITLSVCGFLLLASAVCVAFLRYRHREILIEKTEVTSRSRAFLQQAKEGVRYVFANQAQKASTIAAFCLSFATVFVVLSVIFHSKATLNLSEQYIGLLLSSAGLGNIVGVLIMNRFQKVNWLYFLCALCLISSIGILLIVSNHFVVMCLGMMIFDGALSMAFVVQLTVQQAVTPDRLLARVRSAIYVIGAAASVLATFLAGTLTEWNSYVALLFGSLMLMVPAFYIFRYKKSGGPMNQLKPMEMKEDK